MAKIEIFDLNGTRVRDFYEQFYQHGPHVLIWNGRDNQGNNLASGVYIIKVLSKNNFETRKVTLVR